MMAIQLEELSSGVIVIQMEQDIETELSEFISQKLAAGSGAFVLDFTGIEYFNSVNIAGVINARNVVSPAGGQLALASLADSLVAIFSVLKLERVFDLSLSRDAAIAAVGG